MADYRNYSQDRTQKRCQTCREYKPLASFRVKKKITGPYLSWYCKPCEKDHVDHYRRFTKAGAAAEITRRLKYRSRESGLPYDLTKQWIVEQLERQEWKCALTGLPLHWQRVKGERGRGYQWDSVSVDRIDAGGPYTKQNVRFVLNIVNLFRNDGGDARMYAVAEALLRYRDEQLRKAG